MLVNTLVSCSLTLFKSGFSINLLLILRLIFIISLELRLDNSSSFPANSSILLHVNMKLNASVSFNNSTTPPTLDATGIVPSIEDSTTAYGSGSSHIEGNNKAQVFLCGSLSLLYSILPSTCISRFLCFSLSFFRIWMFLMPYLFVNINLALTPHLPNLLRACNTWKPFT